MIGVFRADHVVMFHVNASVYTVVGTDWRYLKKSPKKLASLKLNESSVKKSGSQARHIYENITQILQYCNYSRQGWTANRACFTPRKASDSLVYGKNVFGNVHLKVKTPETIRDLKGHATNIAYEVYFTCQKLKF